MMTKRILGVVTLFLFLGVLVNAQTSPGDIAFTAYNADGVSGADDFAFVTLVPITNGTSIHFTDNEWTGTGFNNLNEGELQWTATSNLPAGTVVSISSTNSSPTTSTGTISGGGMDLGASNEQIYALLDVPAISIPSPSFLAGFSNDIAANGNVLTGTGLTAGTDFLDFGNDDDGFEYTGLRSGESDFADYLALIMNTVNWQVETSDGTLILPIDLTAFTISAAVCSVDAINDGMNQTSCNPGTDTYSNDVVVSFSNAPITGTLDVNGQSFAIGTSPQTVTLIGLTADASLVDVTAVFSADGGCTLTTAGVFTAPASCAGDFTAPVLSAGCQNENASTVSYDDGWGLETVTMQHLVLGD